MPFRFYRRIPVIPGVRLNLSKGGASVSFGAPGAHVTFGRSGVRRTIGIPDTGVYYTHVSGYRSHKPLAAPEPVAPPPAAATERPLAIRLLLDLGKILVFIVYGLLKVALWLVLFALELAVSIVVGLLLGSVLAVLGGGRHRRRW